MPSSAPGPFPSRVQWEEHPNALTRLLREKRNAGAEILDLTESNPTHAALDYPSGQILSALADPAAMQYDPNPSGLYSAREAVSRYYAGHGADVSPSRILLTASTSEAYAYLFKLLTSPGDEVLVPRPSYPLFEYLAAMEAVRVRQYPLRYDGAWHIDFAALGELAGERTRAIVVVNPNNPTGSYLKKEEWWRLESFAAERNIAVLSDEVFADYSLLEDPDRVTTLVGACDALTFVMSGLSKVAGLPQMKLGWIVAAGPGHEAAVPRLEWIADTFLSVSTPIQVALPRVLSASATVRQQIRIRTQTNLAILHKAVRQNTPCHVLPAEGGWYAVLRVPNTMSEEARAIELLAADNVLVQPGFFYDFESEAFLVLSLLTPAEIFSEGVRRILGRMTE
ncbi:MAG: pyridoxal phosphate-dependent aminotransferase [Bryobacteraceae bacterium]